MTLAEFLTARLDEDERVAKAAIEQSSEEGSEWWFDNATPESPREFHIARHNMARVLREVEAKRKILAGIERDAASIPFGHRFEAGQATLRALAAVYSDHPQYDSDWA